MAPCLDLGFILTQGVAIPIVCPPALLDNQPEQYVPLMHRDSHQSHFVIHGSASAFHAEGLCTAAWHSTFERPKLRLYASASMVLGFRVAGSQRSSQICSSGSQHAQLSMAQGRMGFIELGGAIAEAAAACRNFLVADTVAHEMAHLWCGDLVTMAWWSDLWLNAGRSPLAPLWHLPSICAPQTTTQCTTHTDCVSRGAVPA